MSAPPTSGSLYCVGLGIALGSHLAPRARAVIEEADVVFALTADPLTDEWLKSIRSDVRSLQGHYRLGEPRSQSYATMQHEILGCVKAGQRVCVAVYGHPGVFARVPHEVIRAARALGLSAVMEPAVSAADCLYADLGIDMADHGCAHYEATNFLRSNRSFDTAAYLILWQVGVVGDDTLALPQTGIEQKYRLSRKLERCYPAEHKTILYEAGRHVLEPFVCIDTTIGAFPQAPTTQRSTLVILPIAHNPRYN